MRALLLLLLAFPAFGSALFDGSNDSLTGTFTGNYADPLTLAFKVKIADHPATGQTLGQVGNSSSSNNDSYACRTSTTDNAFSAAATNSGGTAGTGAATGFVDDTWVSVICRFVSDTARNVRVQATQGSDNTTSITVADVIQFVKLGESLGGAQDFAGRIAEVALWDVNLGSTDRDAYVNNDCTAEIDPTNLIGYWPLIDDASDFTNDGLDSGADLTANGNAAIDADHPTMGACASTSAAVKRRRF